MGFDGLEKMKFLVLRAIARVSERFELDSIVTLEEAHI
jgi:hypothetical protein